MLMEGLWLRVHGIGRLFSDPQTSRNESAQYVSCGNSASLVNYLGLFAIPAKRFNSKLLMPFSLWFTESYRAPSVHAPGVRMDRQPERSCRKSLKLGYTLWFIRTSRLQVA